METQIGACEHTHARKDVVANKLGIIWKLKFGGEPNLTQTRRFVQKKMG